MPVNDLILPLDFGLEDLYEQNNNNAAFLLADGERFPVSSLMLGFHSPVIKERYIKEGILEIDVEEFSFNAVKTFCEAMYCGHLEINKPNFREVNKMCHVFQVSWMVLKCVQYFQKALKDALIQFSHDDVTFMFEEAIYFCEVGRSASLMDVWMYKMKRECEWAGCDSFIRKYLKTVSNVSNFTLGAMIGLTRNHSVFLQHIRDDISETNPNLDNISRFLLQNISVGSVQESDSYCLVTEIFDILLKDEDSRDWKMLNKLERRITREFMVKYQGCSKGDHNGPPLATPHMRKNNANDWVKTRDYEKVTSLDAEEIATRKFKGTFTALLDKITRQNFKEFSIQIMQLGLFTMQRLEQAAELIFEKAVLEPARSQIYANLCKLMSSIRVPGQKDTHSSPFRKILLNRCQDEFFKEKTEHETVAKESEPEEPKKKYGQREMELQYKKTKQKKKMLGNIKFIGELFNLTMISSKIILLQCIGNLLNERDITSDLPDEEAIECLSKLFPVVGKKLEKECDTDEKKKMFERNFSEFKSFSSKTNYPAHIRFMVQDVVELRDNNWVPTEIDDI